MPRFDDVDPEGRLIITSLESVGLVAAGANGPADILITKSATDGLKLAATAPHSTATTDKPWDAGRARRGYGNDAAKLRAAHAWRDPSGDPTAKASYKFPHHEGGSANLGAVRNGLARLSSADIPASDKAGVRAHLAKHLRDGGGEPAAASVSLTLSEANLTVLPNVGQWAFGGGETFANTPNDLEVDDQVDRPPEEVSMGDPIDLTDDDREALDVDVREYIEKLEADLVEAREVDRAPDDDDDSDDILKDADPAIRDLVAKHAAAAEAAQHEAAEANTIAKAERDARVLREHVDAAEAFKLFAPADELGPMLVKIETALGTDEFGKFTEWLTAAQGKIESSILFDEIGRAGGGTKSMTSAEAQVDAKAKELSAASDLTYAQAYAQVLKSDSDLAEAVVTETRQGGE